MNGAQSLIRTLYDGGVDTCFMNPGTSEMHFVDALDFVPEMRSILCLFEGVAAGCADGWARMTGRPAATLLHLGPGLGNGISNLHNGRKAHSPIVNIVGDHATYHLKFDAPLTADIEGLARPVSGWVRTSPNARAIAADGAAAIAAARTPPGQVATLILPADTAWGEADGPAPPQEPAAMPPVPEERVAAIADLLRRREETVILVGDAVMGRDALSRLTCRIAAHAGARVVGRPPVFPGARGAPFWRGFLTRSSRPSPCWPAPATLSWSGQRTLSASSPIRTVPAGWRRRTPKSICWLRRMKTFPPRSTRCAKSWARRRSRFLSPPWSARPCRAARSRRMPFGLPLAR